MFVSSAVAEAGSKEGRTELLTHLVFVEFQYTTCLLAAAAEMMLKRRTVAVHAGTAPGVRATEPMLTSTKGGPVVANTGEELKKKKKFPAAASTTCGSDEKKSLRVTCCRVT